VTGAFGFVHASAPSADRWLGIALASAAAAAFHLAPVSYERVTPVNTNISDNSSVVTSGEFTWESFMTGATGGTLGTHGTQRSNSSEQGMLASALPVGSGAAALSSKARSHSKSHRVTPHQDKDKGKGSRLAPHPERPDEHRIETKSDDVGALLDEHKSDNPQPLIDGQSKGRQGGSSKTKSASRGAQRSTPTPAGPPPAIPSEANAGGVESSLSGATNSTDISPTLLPITEAPAPDVSPTSSPSSSPTAPYRISLPPLRRPSELPPLQARRPGDVKPDSKEAAAAEEARTEPAKKSNVAINFDESITDWS